MNVADLFDFYDTDDMEPGMWPDGPDCDEAVSQRGDAGGTSPIDILREHFGYESFRPGQAQIVEGIIAGRDCVGVMPTGAGKSICYQVPGLSLAAAGAGITLVVSPLVSLMHDQVRALVDAGIAAAYLNSQLSHSQQATVIDRARNGSYSLLYIAPERLSDPRFLEFAAGADIALIAVDEAHCVSQWGQDFRPSYLGIADFIETLPARPRVAAFTATATPRVADDIVRLLHLRSPLRVTTGFDRPNLRFSVEQLTDKRKLARVASWAIEHPGDSGIVYCSTRKATEEVHRALVKAGVSATRYHAGLTNAERDANQRAFVMDEAPVMVATNAFGMGIDKSNVRYVIHFNMPGSLEAYYQEAGRAGRDGEPSECLLFWNDGDIATCRFFIEQESSNEALTDEEKDAVRSSQRRRLATMASYCMTTDCLRATILRYFGEQAGQGGVDGAVEGDVAASGCGNCSNCDGGVNAEDVTDTARAVMRCVQELRGRFGKGIVADVLHGNATARVRQFGLDQKRTFGTCDASVARIKEVVELLAAGEYLAISEGRYPLVGFGPRYREAAEDGFRMYIKRARAGGSSRKSGGARLGDAGGGAARRADDLQTEEARELFDHLRLVRKRLASEEGVPPYIVFSDATLRAMASEVPRTEDELLAISGVGPAKLARYGQAFLGELRAWKA